MASKLVLFLPLMLMSCLVAAVFGAAHNQVSYTLGAEYFTRFKFRQFGLGPPETPPRLAAAQIGVLASWWMGLVIGLPVLLLALIDNAARFVGHWRRAIAVTIGLSVLCALAGAVAAPSVVTPELAARIVPAGVQDQTGFLRAAGMHEGSYLGGVLGLVAALVLIIIQSLKEKRK